MAEFIGVVPAGGRGSRLAPYPGPKELFPIGWQPYSANGEVHRRPKVVSQYVIEAMAAAGIEQVFMIVGDHKYDLLRYYGSGERFGVHISYLFQEEPRGMVQAIDLAFPWTRDASVVLGMPDTIIHPSDAFRRLIALHRSQPADLSLGLFGTNRPYKFGMVSVDSQNRVTRHVDKPAETDMTLMWGFGVWEEPFTALLHEVARTKMPPPLRQELILGDVIDEALRRGVRVAGHHIPDGYYLDIGTYDEIIEAQEKVRGVQR